MSDYSYSPSILHDVTTVGDAYVELQATDCTLPEAEHFDRRLGGSAAHIAVYTRLLGGDAVCVAAVGADALGTFIQNSLKRYGVNTSGLQFSREHPTTLLFSAQSGRILQTTYYRLADWQFHNTKEHVALAQASRIVHASGFCLWKHPARHSVFEILRLTKKFNSTTVLQPLYEPAIWRDKNDAAATIKKTLQFADIATPTIDDAEHLFGKAPQLDLVKRYHDFGVPTVILTMGREGCIVSDPEGVEHIPAAKAKVLDPAGANEAWHAGLYHALNSGKSLQTAARFANAVAAYVVQHKGNLIALPEADKLSRDLLGAAFNLL